MPDFERLTDNLRETISSDPIERAYQRGVTRGKTIARIEVAAAATLLGLVVLLVVSNVTF